LLSIRTKPFFPKEREREREEEEEEYEEEEEEEQRITATGHHNKKRFREKRIFLSARIDRHERR
jgi:hypothetical protein